MSKQQIQEWIAQGFHVLKDGQPIRVTGDLWEYLDRLDEEDMSVYVLEELAKLSDEELAVLS